MLRYEEEGETVPEDGGISSTSYLLFPAGEATSPCPGSFFVLRNCSGRFDSFWPRRLGAQPLYD